MIPTINATMSRKLRIRIRVVRTALSHHKEKFGADGRDMAFNSARNRSISLTFAQRGT